MIWFGLTQFNWICPSLTDKVIFIMANFADIYCLNWFGPRSEFRVPQAKPNHNDDIISAVD